LGGIGESERLCYHPSAMLTRVRNLHPPTRVLARRLPDLHSAVFRALNVLLPDGIGRSDCLVSRESAPVRICSCR